MLWVGRLGLGKGPARHSSFRSPRVGRSRQCCSPQRVVHEGAWLPVPAFSASVFPAGIRVSVIHAPMPRRNLSSPRQGYESGRVLAEFAAQKTDLERRLTCGSNIFDGRLVPSGRSAQLALYCRADLGCDITGDCIHLVRLFCVYGRYLHRLIPR